MQLNFRTLGNGKPLVILHGLFGSADNWQSQAKIFATYFQVYLIDLRNHGHSPWSDEHNYTILAEDVQKLLEEQKVENAIVLGHSMGGKVAMTLAQNTIGLVEKLIVVDMGMKQYPLHHQHILGGLNAVDLNSISSRSEVDLILREHINSEGVLQFLLKNLYWKNKGSLAWRMNFKALEIHMDEILEAIPEKEVMIQTLFIRGGLSNYILDDDIPDLENNFPDSQFETIETAGHWVHAEAPDEFISIVLGFCLR